MQKGKYWLNKKRSEETKRKISEAQKGKPRPYLKNVVRTKEWYEKIVTSRRKNGTYIISEKKRERMRQGAIGRIMPKMSEESKEKKRQSNLKTWSDPILRERHGQTMKIKLANMDPDRRRAWIEKTRSMSKSEKNRERARIQLENLRKNPEWVKMWKENHQIGRSKVNVNGKNNPFYGKKHSIETRKLVSKTKKESPDTPRGEKVKSFIDGRGNLRKEERIVFSQTLEYRLFRESVFKRDDYTCIMCKKRGIKICVDHIKSYRNYPELRIDINNGRTLCIDCHKKTPNYGRKEDYAKIIQTPTETIGLVP